MIISPLSVCFCRIQCSLVQILPIQHLLLAGAVVGAVIGHETLPNISLTVRDSLKLSRADKCGPVADKTVYCGTA